MKTHRWLWHVIRRTGGPAGGARREPRAGTARARAARGILVPALVLGSLGATAAASPGTASASNVPVSAHQLAHSLRSCNALTSPWMYTSVTSPWMYTSVRSPWMYTSVTNTSVTSPWMYTAVTSPWMYRAPASGAAAAFRPASLRWRDRCLLLRSLLAGCRAALHATSHSLVVVAPATRHRLRCAVSR